MSIIPFGSIDPVSLGTLYLQPMCREHTLSTATGFVIRHGPYYFIVTNWHVVTGVNPATDLCIDKNLMEPTKIKVFFHKEGALGEWLEYEMPLFDSISERVWLEHPDGKAVDVVLIRIPPIVGIKVYTINDALSADRALLAPAYPVSIVGYPLGLNIGGKWPIWKTGHVASDVVLDYSAKPAFLIDATTKSGMSGSPVIIRTKGPFVIHGGGMVAQSSNYVTNLIGIYSGRIDCRSEIGICWKTSVIDEIIESNLLKL